MPAPLPRSSRRRAILGLCALVTILVTPTLSACGSDAKSEDTALSAAGRTGKEIAAENGCGACHTASGAKSTGPTWKGLAGSEVPLADGSTVTADDAYLRQSIADPKAKIRDGFPSGLMPTYDLSDADLDAIIAYLHDLATPASGEDP